VAKTADVVLGERYRLIRRIASGGMGAVWEAEDTVLHRRVAVKLLSESLASEPRFAERFRREALAAARLSHPSIASIFDYGENGGPPFIVMELVHGETLAERLRRQGRLPQDEAVRVAASVAAALQAAHDAGIVHRDVKPGNVMLTTSAEVRVLDFGIAAAAGAPLTATGARMGTATYLSPEQVRGEPPTGASDVYSLGVMLYEMLAGRPPFLAENPVAVAAQHIDQSPPALAALAPDASAHVVAACERALAKDPAARPPSAAAFAAMLTGQAQEPTRPRGEQTAVLPPPEPTGVLESTGIPPLAGLRDRARKRVPVWGVALALIAVGLVALLVFLNVTGASTPPPASGGLSVPNVIGLSKGDAQRAIRQAGLQVGDVLAAPGEHDVVVRTDPPSGSQVAPGSTVTLYVGSPPKKKDQGNGEGDGHGQGGGGG
jgi:eukaryotic-like serine/threonine-protein kinase